MTTNTDPHPNPHVEIVAVDSAAPIAALDGEMPELIGLEIARTTIESGDTGAVLRRLRQLTADRTTVLAGKGRLLLVIGGYDDDPRHLALVPEYANYMQKLMREWPYFGWFCGLNGDFPAELIVEVAPEHLPDGAFFNLLLVNACTGVAPRLDTPSLGWSPIEVLNEKIRDNLSTILAGLGKLGEDNDIPEAIVVERMQAIEQMLQDRGVL